MNRWQSFESIKYLLALCVLLGHGFIVLYPHMQMHIEAYAVDGFFILSGFFLAKSCVKLSEVNKSPFIALKSLIINRIKRLLPELVFGALLTALIYVIVISKPIDLTVLIYNFLFLAEVNKIPSLFCGMWYISVLVWTSAFLGTLYFFVKKETLQYIVLPTIILLTVLCIAPNVGSLVMHGNTFKIFSKWSDGWFKGLLELSLGMETYFIALYFKSRDIRIKYARAFELFALLLILKPMLSYTPDITDFILLPGYMILVILLYLKQEYLLKILSWKYLSTFTSCSFMMYILNVVILETIRFEGGYLNYPIWLVCIAILVGVTVIACICHIICGMIMQSLPQILNLLSKKNIKKFISPIIYSFMMLGVMFVMFVYYNNNIITINLFCQNGQCSSLNLNNDKVVSKDFKIFLNTKLNHVQCRFYTWKNKYDKDAMLHFKIVDLKDKNNIAVMSKDVRLNNIIDNAIFELRVDTVLQPGEYKFVISVDRSEKPFAVSAIRTPGDSHYYVNGVLSTNKNDIQCMLKY
jgi:peptidoglycan/LPS O-acetylase OafA/YrhL